MSFIGPALSIGSALAPGLLDVIFNGKNRKAQAKGLELQAALARNSMDLQNRQANIDLPFRRNLMQALMNRQQRRTPRIMPGQVALSNPMRQRNQVRRHPGPGGEGGFRSSALQGLMQQRQAQGMPQKPQAQHINLLQALQQARAAR